MNHTQNLLKKYIQKQQEYREIGDELHLLVVNGVSGSGLDGIREKIRIVKGDMNEISKEFIEQFIIND